MTTIEQAIFETCVDISAKIPSDDKLQREYPLQYMSHEQIYTSCNTLMSLLYELKSEISVDEYLRISQMIWLLYAYSSLIRNKKESISFHGFYAKWKVLGDI